MSRRSKSEYWKAVYWRYRRAPKPEKHQILTEFCRTCPSHRQYAIRKLNGPPPPHGKPKPAVRRRRGLTDSPPVLAVLREVGEAAGYPGSVRLSTSSPTPATGPMGSSFIRSI